MGNMGVNANDINIMGPENPDAFGVGVEGVRAVPIGESYSLLDWGEETPIPKPNPISTPNVPYGIGVGEGGGTGSGLGLEGREVGGGGGGLPATTPIKIHKTSQLVLKSSSEQQAAMTSSLFQSLWSSSLTLYTGTLTNDLFSGTK